MCIRDSFCVRNSGASAVVEGVGDHGCEYMTGGTVLVLGPTGRNFAAGMSGGTAFVLDLDESLVNRELVDVVPLRTSDRETVLDLLTQHVELTGSTVAKELLDDPESGLARLSLVLPRDYQRVLDVRAQAEAEGLDIEGPVVWDRIMEASRG